MSLGMTHSWLKPEDWRDLMDRDGVLKPGNRSFKNPNSISLCGSTYLSSC